MERKYIGCHNAAEAEGKVECWNSYLGAYDRVIYFGEEEDMFNYLASRNRKDYTAYYRPLNWETGRKGNWQIVKSTWG